MPDLLGREAVATLLLKGTAAALRFLTSFILVALLGASGFGVVAYVIAWVSFLAVPSVVGLDIFAVREVAARQDEGEPIVVFRRWAEGVAVSVAGFLVLLSLAAIELDFLDAETGTALLFAIGALPALAYIRVRQAILTGFGRVIPAQIPDALIRPASFLVLVAFFYFFQSSKGWEMEPYQAAFSYVFSMYAALIAVTIVLARETSRRGLPAIYEVDTKPDRETRRAWWAGTLPLVSMALLHVILSQIDVLMLGPLRGSLETGIYAVAVQGAALLTMILTAVNTPLGPRIARLGATEDHAEIQRLAVLWARRATFAALVPGLFLIFYGDLFLGLFGAEMLAGRHALAVLAGGQLINIAMGSVALLLVMTGHGRDAAVGVAVGAVLNVVLNAVLIPRYGLDGAAWASSASVVAWNLLLLIQVRRRLGIHPSVFGRVGRA